MNRWGKSHGGSFGSCVGGKSKHLIHQNAQGTPFFLGKLTREHDTDPVGDENEGIIQV